jgi:hypothetical protein
MITIDYPSAKLGPLVDIAIANLKVHYGKKLDKCEKKLAKHQPKTIWEKIKFNWSYDPHKEWIDGLELAMAKDRYRYKLGILEKVKLCTEHSDSVRIDMDTLNLINVYS